MIDFKSDVLPLKNRLYRLALRITRNIEESEDIVQDTMLKAWVRRAELEHVDSIEAYLMRTCHNLAVDRTSRSHQDYDSLDNVQATMASSDVSPLAIVDAEGRHQWLLKVVNSLPMRQREVMHLRDVEGKAYKEIASILGLTEEQVKITLFRARQKVKERFKNIERYGL